MQMIKTHNTETWVLTWRRKREDGTYALLSQHFSTESDLEYAYNIRVKDQDVKDVSIVKNITEHYIPLN